MESVDILASRLSNPDTHSTVLPLLLHHQALSHDISTACPRLVRHILNASSPEPSNLSLCLDLLLSSPSHNFWPQTLSSIVHHLSSNSPPHLLLALSKLPLLPHPAKQHLLLFALKPLLSSLHSSSLHIRRRSVPAIASFILVDRPLTVNFSDGVRLQHLDDKQITVVRRGIETLFYALLNAVFDTDDSVASDALERLTRYAVEATWEREPAVLKKSLRVGGMVVWNVLLENAPKITERMQGGKRGGHAGIIGLVRMASAAMGKRFGGKQNAMTWAQTWIDRDLMRRLEGNGEDVVVVCEGVFLICAYAGEGDASGENVARWGMKAINRLVTRLQDGAMSEVEIAEGLGVATKALAALSKNDAMAGKFVGKIVITVLPMAESIGRKEERFEALSLMASTVVEYDLSGREGGGGSVFKGVLSSKLWKDIMSSGEGEKGGDFPSEVVCCFAQSLLEASRKIAKCMDSTVKRSLTDTWAVMLALLMNKTRMCLGWKQSVGGGYAREMFLKIFDALGQYSAYLGKMSGGGMEEYERLQESLVKETLEQKEVGTRASLLICVTKYWLTSGLNAESNIGHVLRAIWKHMQEHYRDEEVMMNELKTGALWSDARQGSKNLLQRPGAVEGGYVSTITALSKRTRAVFDTVNTSVTTAIETRLFGSIALATAAAEGSTLTTDYAYSSLAAMLALVAHNPPIAEKAVKILQKYIAIMEDAESADFIVLEAVRNTIAAIEVYQDEFYPKLVQIRQIPGLARFVLQRGDRGDSLAWMKEITESCVFGTSRLEDPEKESSMVETEEAILHTAVTTKRRMRPFFVGTMHSFDAEKAQSIEGDQQQLNGASDPFSVVASHSMDTVKGLAIVRVDILNRSPFRASNVALVWSASGALSPLPDASNSQKLGNLERGISVTQRITLSVRTGQGYAGRVFFSIHTWKDGDDEENSVEQSCVPYYIPSSDVLLLRKPPVNAGVDVFRRRWDLMRYSISFQAHLRQNQSVDSFVDTLERRSKCLRQVGRMRTFSHVSALVADSSRGDYVAVAVLAPEAIGNSGEGPCVLYITIRSNSDGYNRAFREECRDWLSRRYRIIVPDEELSEEAKALSMKPQDAYFITESRENLSPYQRWRVAHAVRQKY